MAAARLIEVAEQLLLELPQPLDRLPFTAGFDDVYAKFLERSGSELSRHEVWWTLLHARKRGLGRGPSGRRHRPSAPETRPAEG